MNVMIMNEKFITTQKREIEIVGVSNEKQREDFSAGERKEKQQINAS